MAPSAPGYPGERASAQRPASRPEYESHEWYESRRASVAAGTDFTELLVCSGRADSWQIDVQSTNVELRFRERGQAAGTTILVTAAGPRDYPIRASILEGRDPAAGGGQAVLAIARFASRAIEVRDNRPGPSRERPMLPESALAAQVPTRE